MNLLTFKSFLPIFALVMAVAGFSSLAAAGSECDMAPPTQINITPDTNEVTYDYSRSLSTIQQVDIDTVDPYGIHSNSITQGFMEGQISMKREVEMDFQAVNGGREACLWYKTITVDLHIDPKIVIAREVKRDRCMHDAVKEHENKHVDVDRAVVNKAAQDIGKSLYDTLSKTGFVVGPVPAGEAQAVANQMVQRVMALTQAEYERLGFRRAELQQQVDSLEEYERVRALCPNFYDKKKLLYKRALRVKQGQ